MSDRFTVYALRIAGSLEVRYIGQTRHTAEKRLVGNRGERSGGNCPFGNWLRDYRGQIEAVTLDTFATRDEAKAAERLAIRLFANGGHRLFNGDHNPRKLRPLDPWTPPRERAAA